MLTKSPIDIVSGRTLHADSWGIGRPLNRTEGTRLHILQARFAVTEFVAATLVAFTASHIYYFTVYRTPSPHLMYFVASLVIATLLLLTSLSLHHFGLLQSKPRHWFMANGLAAVALAFSFFLSILFLFKLLEDYSRGVFFFQYAGVNLAVLIIRTIEHTQLQNAIETGAVQARRAILIGNERNFSQITERLNETGIHVVGTFQFPRYAKKKSKKNGAGPRAKSEELRSTLKLCRQLNPDDIIILGTSDRLSAVPRLIDDLSEIPAAIHLVPVSERDLFARSKPAELGNLTTLRMRRLPLSTADVVLKRAFDIVAASAGLILLSPLLLIVAAAIKIDSPGPALFRQKRHGYNNETIDVLKFRTMRVVESDGAFKQTVSKDPRLTKLGTALRMNNIDELPQLINVLRGEMSLVGPRPHPIALNKLFEERIAPFSRRHIVKPGVTGWAQVNGYRGPTDTLAKMQRRLEYDLYYIDNWSFFLDMQIILMTLFSKTAYKNAY